MITVTPPSSPGNLLVTSFTQPDLSAIAEAIAIQNEFAIAHDLLASGKTVAPNGALIGSYVPEQVVKKINGGAILYLARQEGDSTCLGYLFQTTGQQFHEQFPGSRIEWSDPALEMRYAEEIKMGRFIYLCQIGVRLCFHGRDISSCLLSSFEQHVNGALIVCSVMKTPISNPRSKRFFNKHGYEDAGYFFKQVFGGFEQSTSNLLIKDLR